MFSHIRHVVGEKFAENVNTTIGGFIFLRFFCPAISSPEAYGILEGKKNRFKIFEFEDLIRSNFVLIFF